MKKTLRGCEFEQYSPRSWLEQFEPDCRGVIKESIQAIEQEIKEQEKLIKKLENFVNKSNTDKFTRFYCREIIKMQLVSEILKQDKYLFHLKNYWNLLNPATDSKHVTDYKEKLERARGFPIYEIASRYLELKQFGNKYRGLCPFHNEKTPSFYIYTENNTYHCYGCSAHGDVINLTMELCATDFKGAIDILKN